MKCKSSVDIISENEVAVIIHYEGQISKLFSEISADFRFRLFDFALVVRALKSLISVLSELCDFNVASPMGFDFGYGLTRSNHQPMPCAFESGNIEVIK